MWRCKGARVLPPLLLSCLCVASAVNGLNVFVRSEVLRDVLENSNFTMVFKGGQVDIIKDNMIPETLIILNSLLAISTAGHELDQTDRLIFDYTVPSGENANYTIDASTASPALDIFFVNTSNQGNLSASSQGVFEIDFKCKNRQAETIVAKSDFYFTVMSGASPPLQLKFTLNFRVDCNVTVPTTTPPTTEPPPTPPTSGLSSTPHPLGFSSSPDVGTAATSTSGSKQSTSDPEERTSDESSLPLLTIVLICVGAVAVALALVIVLVVCMHRRRARSKSLLITESPTNLEAGNGQHIRNNTDFSREEFNNAGAVNSGSAIGSTAGQVVDLPAKSVEGDDEALFTKVVGSEFLIKRDEVHFGRELGKGAFGVVYEGMWKSHHVAIKTMKGRNTGSDGQAQIEKFLEEANRMKDFHHVNVLGLIGVCSNEYGHPQIVVPFMGGGDLMTYLRAHDAVLSPGTIQLTEQQLINFSVQSASGMEYLASLNFVHRDLAARNCMLSSDLVVKIADFGLARDIDDSSYYVISSEWKLPVRWMAPESLTVHKFSVMSDVWSYGVLLWEIFTSGQVPYPGIENSEITAYLMGGKRLMQPNRCPDKLFSIMNGCWRHVAQDRPSFTQILRHFADFDQNLYQNILKLTNYNNIDPDSRDASHSAIELATVSRQYAPPTTTNSEGYNGAVSNGNANGVAVSPASPAAQFELLQSPAVAEAPSNQSRASKTATMMTTVSFSSDQDDYESMKRRLTSGKEGRPGRENEARVYENFTESEL